MKLVVLSDIHGNDIAFEACLSYLKQDIDAYCLLGDYIGELAGIRHTMEMLYRLMEEECCYIIRGNKEEYQLGSRRGASGVGCLSQHGRDAAVWKNTVAVQRSGFS